MRPVIAAGLAFALLACNGKKSDPTGSAAPKEDGSGAPAKPASATKTIAPGDGFVRPPLGAADAIEPPSRDIVPGMLVSAAKEKGAQPDTVDYTMKWRPDTSLWLTKEFGLVAQLIVTYPAKDWEATKAKWGKPAIGDDTWIGANWMVTLSGCASGPCSVMFVRSPITFLGKSPAPPDALANLRAGMTPAEVKAATGLPLAFGAGLDNGFGWDLSASYTDDKLEEFDMNIQRGSDADWLPSLAKLWGEPTQLGNDKVWANPSDGWLVQFGWAGTLLRFYPMKPAATHFARTGPESLLTIARATMGKPKSALTSVPGYVEKRESIPLTRTELSLVEPVVDFGFEKDAVSELDVRFLVESEGDSAKLVKVMESAWGPITKKKDENDEETQTLSVDGFAVQLNADESAVRVRITK